MNVSTSPNQQQISKTIVGFYSPVILIVASLWLVLSPWFRDSFWQHTDILVLYGASGFAFLWYKNRSKNGASRADWLIFFLLMLPLGILAALRNGALSWPGELTIALVLLAMPWRQWAHRATAAFVAITTLTLFFFTPDLDMPLASFELISLVMLGYPVFTLFNTASSFPQARTKALKAFLLIVTLTNTLMLYPQPTLSALLTAGVAGLFFWAIHRNDAITPAQSYLLPAFAAIALITNTTASGHLHIALIPAYSLLAFLCLAPLPALALSFGYIAIALLGLSIYDEPIHTAFLLRMIPIALGVNVIFYLVCELRSDTLQQRQQSLQQWHKENQLVAAVTLAVTVVITMLAIAHAGRTLNHMAQLDDAQHDITYLERLLIDRETGQRGYHLTDKTHFLEPYEKAAKPISETLFRLKAYAELTDISLTPLIQQLAATIDARGEYFATTLSLQQNGKVEEASALISLGRGKEMTDRLRAQISELRQLIEEKQNSSELRLALSLGFLPILALMGAVLLFMHTLKQAKALRKRASDPIIDLANSMAEFEKLQSWTLVRNGKEMTEIANLQRSSNSLIQAVQAKSNSLKATQRSLEAKNRELEMLAYYDQVTSLPNRQFGHQKLETAILKASELHQTVAVLKLNLSNLNRIQNTFGAMSRDSLLKHAAQRLLECIRPGDLLFKSSEDNFVIAMSDVRNTNQILFTCNQISGVFETPFLESDETFLVTPSFGVALYPKQGETAEELIQFAAIALAEMPRSNQLKVNFYSEEMNKHQIDLVKSAQEIKDGIARNEFVIHYQPVFDLAQQKVVGSEALVRWQRPGQGLLYPDSFIDIAEQTGLIIPLTSFVLEEACRQTSAWNSEHGLSLKVAVNLSAVHFNSGSIRSDVSEALVRSGLAPKYLGLEITESVLLDDTSEAAALLTDWRQQGIEILIDDFGTGYSSLSNLCNFSLDVLKIDKSFMDDILHNPKQQAVLKTIIEVAKVLGLKTIAEGVEDQQVLDYIEAEGANEVQGYYFSKPIPSDEFEANFLAAQGPN